MPKIHLLQSRVVSSTCALLPGLPSAADFGAPLHVLGSSAHCCMANRHIHCSTNRHRRYRKANVANVGIDSDVGVRIESVVRRENRVYYHRYYPSTDHLHLHLPLEARAKLSCSDIRSGPVVDVVIRHALLAAKRRLDPQQQTRSRARSLPLDISDTARTRLADPSSGLDRVVFAAAPPELATVDAGSAPSQDSCT